eukprot:178644_1
MAIPTRSDLHRIEVPSIFDIIHMANDKEKMMVYGYIRRQKIVIPELVTVICLWYYVCFDEETIVESFDHMNLKLELLRGIYHSGLEKPSMISQRAIVPITRYQDIIAQTQTGVRVFGIASLQLLDPTITQCQILIITPTRELATNTLLCIKNVAYYLNITTTTVCGGTAIRDSILLLSKGIQLVVGTPGRVHDMIERNLLELDYLQLLVIDRADQCLDFGFKEILCTICDRLGSNVQRALFCSSTPGAVLEFADTYLIKPVKVIIPKQELTLCGIKQFYIAVEKEDYKRETLMDLFESLNITQCVIYVNTKQKAIWLNDEMQKEEFNCGCIYQDMVSVKRKSVLNEFRNGIKMVLISTDLMEFGVDLYTMKYLVSLTINYDLPTDKEHYISRIGRSGKYGRKGVVINFVCDDEQRMLQDIQTHYNTTINELPMDVDAIL